MTGAIPAAVTAALGEHFELVDSPAGADGILAILTTAVDDDYLAAAGPQLRIVANYGVGVDNVDLGAARRRDIVVSNTPDVLTEATAELAIGLTLALLRRIVEGDRLLRARRPWRWEVEFMLGEGLHGKRFGIVGAGRIGRATARLAEAFGATVVLVGRDDSLAELLPSLDVVSLHCPLTEQTRHLIDASALELMRPTAVLVNTARGPIVDEHALVAALAAGELGGAALDVFEYEPRGDRRAARVRQRRPDAAPRQRHARHARGDGHARGERAPRRTPRGARTGERRLSSARERAELREPAVHELNGHRTFADRGRAALGRARAHVAGREDPRDAGLEQAVGADVGPVRMKPLSSRATTSPSHSVHGSAPRKRKRNANGRRSPSRSVTASSWPSAPCNAATSLRSRTATP